MSDLPVSKIPNLLDLAAEDLKQQQKVRAERRHRKKNIKYQVKQEIMSGQDHETNGLPALSRIIRVRSEHRARRSLGHTQSMAQASMAGLALLGQQCAGMREYLCVTAANDEAHITDQEAGENSFLREIISPRPAPDPPSDTADALVTTTSLSSDPGNALVTTTTWYRLL
jgi:hypothetical protein